MRGSRRSSRLAWLRFTHQKKGLDHQRIGISSDLGRDGRALGCLCRSARTATVGDGSGSKRARSETQTGAGRGKEGAPEAAAEDVSVISRTTGSPASSPSPAKAMVRRGGALLGYGLIAQRRPSSSVSWPNYKVSGPTRNFVLIYSSLFLYLLCAVKIH